MHVPDCNHVFLKILHLSLSESIQEEGSGGGWHEARRQGSFADSDLLGGLLRVAPELQSQEAEEGDTKRDDS